MDYAVSVTDTSIVTEIEEDGLKIIGKLTEYAKLLEGLTTFEKPRGIVFHDLKSATELYSDIPIPAYTSRDLIHLSPTPAVWRDIFLSTVKEMPRVESYYKTTDTLEVAAIAAHELTHHADFFHDDFEGDEENMWFEEGLCEYIPRKLMYPPSKFQESAEIEVSLIQVYKEQYGEYCLSEFGKSGYRYGNGSEYAAAFYDYWRSRKVVGVLVENYFDGSIVSLIECYKNWDQATPLHTYFTNVLKLSAEEAKQLWLR